VVAKVYLNNDAKIPDSVKVNAGLPQKGRSWTLPCYVLKRMFCYLRKRRALQPLVPYILFHCSHRAGLGLA
jgi:hypothetical protein